MQLTIPISVIIPTYNRSSVIKKAIDSVLEQTYPPQEIIVVDDGSTDGTAAQLKEQYGSRIIIIEQKHKGVSAARNRSVAAAHNDWIAFLDSDDIWHPHKLEKQIQFLQDHPEAEIVQTDEIWIRHDKRVNPMNKHAKYSGYIFPQCLPLCIVTPSSVLMKKALFERVGKFDEKLVACEDYDLWLRIAKDTPIYLIPEKLLTRYGGHADQLSAQHWGMDRFRVHALRKLLRSPLTEEQKHQVMLELKKKCAVLAAGALKRKKYFRWIYYWALAHR